MSEFRHPLGGESSNFGLVVNQLLQHVSTILNLHISIEPLKHGWKINKMYSWFSKTSISFEGFPPLMTPEAGMKRLQDSMFARLKCRWSNEKGGLAFWIRRV